MSEHDPSERDDNHNDNRKSDQSPPPKLSGGPMPALLFWLILIGAVFAGVILYRNANSENETEIKQSKFEQLLLDDRILTAIVKKDPADSSITIHGTYNPEEKFELDQPAESEDARPYRTEVIYSDSFDEMLREHCNVREAETIKNLLGNILSVIFPFVLFILIIYFMFSRQLKAAGKGALQFGKSRARLQSTGKEKITFKDVSGIEEAKEEVTEIIEYLKDPGKFQKLGGKIPKGVLMVGPPGTGKTLLARAIAGEADVPFFSISGSDFVEMFVGVGASRVRDMFEEGKKHAPCIIFIDEIDAVGRSRFSGIGGGHDEREQTLNALLVEMDGFEANTGIIVIAATNRPDVLDPALLRPGRFDRQITIDLPDVKGRLGILKVHAKKVILDAEVELEVIAKGTPGYSGADLSNLINEAALLAAHLNKDAIDMSDLEEARDKVRWGKERRSRVISDKDKKVTAYHEAGHTLAGIMCDHAIPLHKVTIIPRGNAYLGATMHLPEQDRYTQSILDLKDELIVLMGGRIAEELIFDEITSGASADIRQATAIAKKMVCSWGMSEKMGPMNYSESDEPMYVARDMNKNRDHSEQTSHEIDMEMRKIIDEAVARCRNILTDHKDKLSCLGETLLEKETMSAAEIYELFNMELPQSLKHQFFDEGKKKETDTPEAEEKDEADEEDTDTSEREDS